MMHAAVLLQRHEDAVRKHKEKMGKWQSTLTGLHQRELEITRDLVRPLSPGLRDRPPHVTVLASDTVIRGCLLGCTQQQLLVLRRPRVALRLGRQLWGCPSRRYMVSRGAPRQVHPRSTPASTPPRTTSLKVRYASVRAAQHPCHPLYLHDDTGGKLLQNTSASDTAGFT